ncbi:MAG: hydrogenase small subunit [Desulfovibrio sp.]|nr:hydrogenase small subunit [Desulfovibrio sp.]
MAKRAFETHYDRLRNNGVSRRDFLKFCSMTAAWLGLAPALATNIAHALETKPRLPVIWIEGLSCTCCTESFIRSSHPLAKDIILNMISLDYNDTLMAAAGFQAQDAFENAVLANAGNYILAVEGNAPFGNDGMYCIDGGRPWLRRLEAGAKHAKAVVAWGTCASWGCIQAARPNPTDATPIAHIIHDKPVIKIPGCPPIPEVMSALVSYVVTFDRLPNVDAQGRFAAFYGQHVHDQCVRRAHFDAGEFVEEWDDDGAKKGYCLYKMGCKGPTTYNACPNTRWNDGVSYPIESGHPCLGCSEQDFFDQGSFYSRIKDIPTLGTMATAEAVAAGVAGTVAVGVAIHAATSCAFHLHEKKLKEQAVEEAKIEAGVQEENRKDK